MDFYIPNISMSIITNIVKHVSDNIEKFNSSVSLHEIEQDSSQVNLMCFAGDLTPAFANVELEIFRSDFQNLSINMSAEIKLEDTPFDKINFDTFQVSDILKKYENLCPIVEESVIHYPADLIGVQRDATRKIRIRFGIISTNIEDENGAFKIDYDEISNNVFVYLNTLHEIFVEIKQYK